MLNARRHSLPVLCCLALAVSAFSAAGASTEKAANVCDGRPPNILFFLADDIANPEAGCYGAPVRTPNIDALAHEGVYFQTCFATPLCQPSRGVDDRPLRLSHGLLS